MMLIDLNHKKLWIQYLLGQKIRKSCRQSMIRYMRDYLIICSEKLLRNLSILFLLH